MHSAVMVSGTMYEVIFPVLNELYLSVFFVQWGIIYGSYTETRFYTSFFNLLLSVKKIPFSGFE